jgi:hypothetical protein
VSHVLLDISALEMDHNINVHPILLHVGVALLLAIQDIISHRIFPIVLATVNCV